MEKMQDNQVKASAKQGAVNFCPHTVDYCPYLPNTTHEAAIPTRPGEAVTRPSQTVHKLHYSSNSNINIG